MAPSPAQPNALREMDLPFVPFRQMSKSITTSFLGEHAIAPPRLSSQDSFLMQMYNKTIAYEAELDIAEQESMANYRARRRAEALVRQQNTELLFLARMGPK